MVYLTRVEGFNAAHKLYNPNWSKDKNWEVFGKCSNENWHGHNYKLEVTVKGKINPETGYFINAKELSAIIKKHITEKLDHRNLNIDIDWIDKNMPTTENIIVAMWQRLLPALPEGCILHKLKLIETPSIFVEYCGD